PAVDRPDGPRNPRPEGGRGAVERPLGPARAGDLPAGRGADSRAAPAGPGRVRGPRGRASGLLRRRRDLPGCPLPDREGFFVADGVAGLGDRAAAPVVVGAVVLEHQSGESGTGPVRGGGVARGTVADAVLRRRLPVVGARSGRGGGGGVLRRCGGV